MAKAHKTRKIVMTEKDIVRFWSKVDRSGGEDACWPWIPASVFKGGYGKFSVRRNGVASYMQSHRIALKLAIGEFVGLALHSCNYTACCNPKHLKPGTNLENIQQAAEQGLMAKKLTIQQVLEIRSRSTEIHRIIASDFGISRRMVSQIIARTRRRYV